MKYTLMDSDSGVEIEIEADNAKEAREQAREWALEGEYGERNATIWVDVYVTDPDGDRERVTTQIDPDEPKCLTKEMAHEWDSPHWLVGGIAENPGVWGSGGGVLITEACMRCGCGRTKDTFAQRHDTGEQGFESVSYSPGRFTYAIDERRAEDND